MGIVGIGVIGRCTLKILGPFEVSYIPPTTQIFLVRYKNTHARFVLLSEKEDSDASQEN